MASIADRDIKPDRSDVASAGRASLRVARRNAAYLVALIYLQDIFWLAASRIQIYYYGDTYRVAPFAWTNALYFVALAVGFSLVALFAVNIFHPMRRIRAGRAFCSVVVLLAVCLNLVSAAYLAGNARYVSGALTGLGGVIYAASTAASLASMVIMVRQRFAGQLLIPIPVVALFIISYAATLDGLAVALTLAVFILLIMKPITIRRPVRVFVVSAVVLGTLSAGLNAKFIALPDYATPDFLLRWTIARFAIQAEQMYTYVSGLSIIGDGVGYYDIIWRMNRDRMNIVLGNPLFIEYPRSISEAMYYDMYHEFEAGSSPGLLLGTYLMGPLGIFVPAIMAFVFLQFFHGATGKISLLRLLACGFMLKQIHANISEYQALISPTTLVFVIFLWACLLVIRPKLRRVVHQPVAATAADV